MLNWGETMNKKQKRVVGVAGVSAGVLLASFAVYSHLENVRAKSSALECAHNLRTLALAIQAHHEATGEYPSHRSSLSESLRGYVESEHIFRCPRDCDGAARDYGSCYVVVERTGLGQMFRLQCPNHGGGSRGIVAGAADLVEAACAAFSLPAAEASPAAVPDLPSVGLAADGVAEVRLPWDSPTGKLFTAPDCFLADGRGPLPGTCLEPATFFVGVAGSVFSFANCGRGGTVCEELAVLRGKVRIVCRCLSQPRLLRPGQAALYLP